MAVTVFALLHEFAGEALHVAVWRRLQQRMRYILLASIAITSLLIGGLLLSETLVPGFHSPLSVAVLGPVAWLLLSVQRVPLLGLSSNQLRQRFVAMVAVWLAYIVAGATWSGAKNIDGDHMGGVTLVVAFLVGSVLTAAMSAFNDYQAAPQGREH